MDSTTQTSSGIFSRIFGISPLYLLIFLITGYFVLVFIVNCFSTKKKSKVNIGNRIIRKYLFANSDFLDSMNEEEKKLMEETLSNTLRNSVTCEVNEKELPKKTKKIKRVSFDPKFTACKKWRWGKENRLYPLHYITNHSEQLASNRSLFLSVLFYIRSLMKCKWYDAILFLKIYTRCLHIKKIPCIFCEKKKNFS